MPHGIPHDREQPFTLALPTSGDWN